MILDKITLSIMILDKITLSIMTPGKMILNIKGGLRHSVEHFLRLS